MTVDIAALRKSHVDGWKPRQSVELDVETLRAMLDELEVLRRLAEVCKLEHDSIPVCDACDDPIYVSTSDGYNYCVECAQDCEVDPCT